MIKNIIFDLSEVIISGYHGIEKIIEQNTDISAEEFFKRKQELWNIFSDTMRGKYSEDEYLAYLIRGTNWNMSENTLKEYIRQCLNIPMEGTIQIVQKLKNKYQLILLSDHVKEWMDYIFENNTALNIFEHQYFSYEYGMLKTDKGCFEHILEDLQINSDQTIFIDDSKENIDMASKSEIEGILFKSAKDLETELKKRGIL